MFSVTPVPVIVWRVMSGVIRKEIQWLIWPVTLMYARARLKEFGWTTPPSASFVVGTS